MLALVTGASGHVGGALCRALLADGHQVVGLYNSDKGPLEGLALTAVAADIEDNAAIERACEGADVVFHAAARVTLSSKEDPRAARTNIEGTRNVIAAVRAKGVGRLVHFSTIHAIDSQGELLPEGRGFAYERSKVDAERLVMRAVADGLDAVVVSPCAVIGPFDAKPSHMGKVFLMQERGLLLSAAEGGQSWVDVRDVAAAAVSASVKGARGARYVVSGTWMTMKDIATLAARIGGSRAPLFTVSRSMLAQVAPFAERVAEALRRPPLLTRASVDALEPGPRPMSCAAERELGHKPRPIRETLTDMLQWFRERGMSPRRPFS